MKPIQTLSNVDVLPATPEGSGERTGSLTRSVYEQLKTDLVSGRYRPGEKLAIEEMRQRFQMGASPIREALNRLLAEGFVSLEEQKGFRVAEVSIEDLEDLIRARCLIDGAAVTESIKRFDTVWEEGIVLALHRLSRVHRRLPGGPDMDSPEWERLHRAFHVALVGGCNSRWLCRTGEQLLDSTERYRLLVSRDLSERKELDEHRAIVDACLARNAEKAVALLEEHYGRTARMIADSFKS